MKGGHADRREMRRIFPGVDLARVPNVGADGNRLTGGSCFLGCRLFQPRRDQGQHGVAVTVRGVIPATTGSAGGAFLPERHGAGGSQHQLRRQVGTVPFAQQQVQPPAVDREGD